MALQRVVVDFFLSDQFCLYRNVLSVIGLVWVCVVVWRLLKTLAEWFCAFYLAPWGIYRTNLKRYGPWAVVTGASEGIGKGYALELARQGINVVIMSRSKEKLQKVADEIEKKYGSEVRIISVDFSEGQSIYPNIAEKVKDLDIGILVNNVGLATAGPKVFSELSADRAYKIVEVNCQSMIQMTKLLLPKMVERKRGIVVNLSSAASLLPLPMSGVYSATKIFVSNFSEVLHKEYSGQGIIVQNVVPCFVATAMSGMKHTNSLVMEANYYARSAVATIGIERYTFGCLSHAIQGFIMQLIPKFILYAFFMKLAKQRIAHHWQKKNKPE